jgi:hypothetical protein
MNAVITAAANQARQKPVQLSHNQEVCLFIDLSSYTCFVLPSDNIAMRFSWLFRRLRLVFFMGGYHKNEMQ